MNMKKMILTGLAALALGACSTKSYVPEKTEARKLTGNDVNAEQQYLKSATGDSRVSRGEIDQIIARYDMLSNASMADGSGDGEKALFEQVKKEYKAAVEDVFNHTDIYFVMTGVDTAEFQNVPANIGASRAVYVGKGAVLGDNVNFTQKEKLLRMARDAWKPYTVTQGVVQAGGGRIQGLEYTALEILKDTAAKIVGGGIGADVPGQKRITGDIWSASVDGKKENGEMSRYFLTAVKPAGYDVPKADKK
jgi:hypothetical protein